MRQENVTWSDALTSCISYGDSGLAKISSQSQQDTITALIGSARAYIGLNDLDNEGTFVWTDGSSLDSYTNWYADNPWDNVIQNCVVVMGTQDGQWRNVGCGKTDIGFICEQSPSIPQSVASCPSGYTMASDGSKCYIKRQEHLP